MVSNRTEEIFHYIYAVLYSPSYRERYTDFLSLDFPRIPFPNKKELFEEMAELGERIVALHLLRSPELDTPLSRFEGQGDNQIAKNKREGFRYSPDRERLYINKTQYFAPLPKEIWGYTIGGYQVCKKWLKDRKERQLTLDEIRTYCRIITALGHTMEIQRKLDEFYLLVEKNTLPFELRE